MSYYDTENELIFEAYSINDIEGDELPTNWKDGFHGDSGFMLKTAEVPFKINGQWFLEVYRKSDRQSVIYSFKDDRVTEYDDFQKWVYNNTKQVRNMDIGEL
jgi:hypothetical protein